MVFFVGRIMGPQGAASAPEDEGDPTFEFDAASRAQLVKDLPGSPLRLEHHEEMEVGRVKTAWLDSTGVYIMGSIEGEGLTVNFAKCTVGVGDAYYGSLSLAHEHLSYRDGSSRKEAVEVSLCGSPRRPGCCILWVSETEGREYKQASLPSKMAETAPTPDQTEKIAQLEAALLKQEKELEEFRTTSSTHEASKADLETQLANLQAENVKLQEAADKETARQKEKADALVQTLAQEWQSVMDVDPEKLSQMATSKNPADSVEFLRLAHMASVKYNARNAELRNQAGVQAAEVRAEKVDAVLNPNKRKRPNVMDVLSKYSDSSGALGLQRAIYNNLTK